MSRRGLGSMKGFITRRAQARTRLNYDCRVLIKQTVAALCMKLPLGKYTAVDEAAAAGIQVLLLEKSIALSKMLERELLAAPQGAGRWDIDGDISTDRGKDDHEEGGDGDEEGRNESGGGYVHIVNTSGGHSK